MRARNYGDVRNALRNRKAFTHSTMSARKVPHNFPTSDTEGYLDVDMAESYVVFSYDEPIAAVRPDGTIWVTDKKYSSTTTKHTNIAREALT